MGGLSVTHWVIIAVVLLVLFGGAKIPQLMRGLGQGMGEFKKGQEESKRTMEEFKKDPEEDNKLEAEKTTADKK